jgi:hypothetical protein
MRPVAQLVDSQGDTVSNEIGRSHFRQVAYALAGRPAEVGHPPQKDWCVLNDELVAVLGSGFVPAVLDLETLNANRWIVVAIAALHPPFQQDAQHRQRANDEPPPGAARQE